jgi:hypothetical protein
MVARIPPRSWGATVMLTDAQYRELTNVRVSDPEAVAKAMAARRRRSELTRDGMLFIVAADHTARGMVGVGSDPRAMAERRTLLTRLLTALANSRVDGVLGSADIIEDLVLLGALEERVAVGTMNRGGLAGAAWELDDRFTAYDADHLVAANLDAGKMLLRIDGSDPGTVPTLESCARAVQALSDRRMLAMVEPIPYTKSAGGAAMTTQPLLLLGGAPGPDPEATFASWEQALAEPTVRGLVVGRALLYPPDGDVAAAVGRAGELVERAAAEA